jgi:hypothetical protein
MKFKLIFLLVVILTTKSLYSKIGIGFNVGGGRFLDVTSKVYENKGTVGDGPSAFIALDFPLTKSQMTEIELALFTYWKLNNNNYGTESENKIKSFTSTSYAFRFYFIDDNYSVRPSIHLGAINIPILSWSMGLGCDFKIHNNFYAQLSTWFFIDVLRIISEYESPPPMLNMSLKYYIK